VSSNWEGDGIRKPGAFPSWSLGRRWNKEAGCLPKLELGKEMEFEIAKIQF